MLEEVGQLLGQGVLILTLDRSVLLVSEHRSRIEKWLTHSLPPDPVIGRLMNKAQLDTFAHEQGFKVPRTFAVRCEDELQRCIGSFSFPCVLKPQIKTVAFVARSPQKAFFIRSAEELWLAWQQVAQWEPEVVIQEWIDGPDTNLVFCLFYATAARRAMAYVMSRHEVTLGGLGLRGGVAGSFPVSARYGKFQHLNWAAKFFLDALTLAERVGGGDFSLGAGKVVASTAGAGLHAR